MNLRIEFYQSRRAKSEAVKLGRWVGSTLPFGWMKQPCKGDRLKHNQLVAHPAESQIYLQMVDWSLHGLGSGLIARKLTDMDVPTRFCGLKNIPLDAVNKSVWDTTREFVANSKKIRQAIEAQNDKGKDTLVGTRREHRQTKSRQLTKAAFCPTMGAD